MTFILQAVLTKLLWVPGRRQYGTLYKISFILLRSHGWKVMISLLRVNLLPVLWKRSKPDLLGDLVLLTTHCMESNTRYRPLYATSAQTRVSLAEHLFKLPCTLAHFNRPECSSAEDTLQLRIIPAFLTVLARLLDGREDEVTLLVQRQTYDVLAKAMTHHNLHPDDSMDHVGDMILRGIGHKDRSVRLSAGYDFGFTKIHSFALTLCHIDEHLLDSSPCTMPKRQAVCIGSIRKHYFLAFPTYLK